jgi:hypothetical protein
MLKMNEKEINTIFDERDKLQKTIFPLMENLIKNDVIKWSPIWYAEALMKFAGFHIYNFDSDEESASDKVWDVIRVGSFNPIKISDNNLYFFDESPYFEPYLIDKENKLFPLGIGYASSAPYDENFNFFFSKLYDSKLGINENLTLLFALVLYGTSILTDAVGEELAEINALQATMSGYLSARKGNQLIV